MAYSHNIFKSILEVRFQPVNDTNQEKSVVQPQNQGFKSLSHSEIVTDKAENLLKHKHRGVSPTEFVTNNEDFGKLKESNDTIFSFGTSK